NPAKFLDGRESGRQHVRVERAVHAAECETVLQRIELVAAGLLVFDRKADEVFRRLALFPVHGEEGHAVAAMPLQRAERLAVCAEHLIVGRHRRKSLSRQSLDALTISPSVANYCARGYACPMAIRIVRLGTPRLRDEGLRLGTVRRPPRGVRKERYGKDN